MRAFQINNAAYLEDFLVKGEVVFSCWFVNHRVSIPVDFVVLPEVVKNVIVVFLRMRVYVDSDFSFALTNNRIDSVFRTFKVGDNYGASGVSVLRLITKTRSELERGSFRVEQLRDVGVGA